MLSFRMEYSPAVDADVMTVKARVVDEQGHGFDGVLQTENPRLGDILRDRLPG